MSDSTWLNVLRQIEPSYDNLTILMNEGPKIKASLKKKRFAWHVVIEENWANSDGECYYTADYGNLDKRCEWAAEQLKDWKTAIRTSHQEWKFSSKKEAEKFITWFSLVWTE